MPDWYRDHHLSPEAAGDGEYLDWAQSAGASVDVAGNVTWPDQTPEYARCRCRPAGHDMSGDGPADLDPTGCPVHAQAAPAAEYENTEPEELF